jgi:type IV secretion system protein VirB3
MSDKKKYPGYNGLARTPNLWGVPYMPALVVFVGSTAVALVSAGIWGPGGLLFFFLGVPVLLFFKAECETDDQGLRILWLELKCRWYWRRVRIMPFLRGKRRSPMQRANVATLEPLRLGRHSRVYEQFFQRGKQPSFERTIDNE